MGTVSAAGQGAAQTPGRAAHEQKLESAHLATQLGGDREIARHKVQENCALGQQELAVRCGLAWV